MAYTISDTSQKALALVLHEYNEMGVSDEVDPLQCEKLGRMLIAMFREHTHPARMFHLIAQVAEGFEPSNEPVDVEMLTHLAWAMAESPKVKPKPELC